VAFEHSVPRLRPRATQTSAGSSMFIMLLTHLLHCALLVRAHLLQRAVLSASTSKQQYTYQNHCHTCIVFTITGRSLRSSAFATLLNYMQSPLNSAVRAATPDDAR